jgi:hypothetical protein
LFFDDRLFSTTSVALFLALFFPQERIFNNFPALFLGLFRFVFEARSFIFCNISALFFKKGILFYFFVSSVLQKSRGQALEKDYHTRPLMSRKIRRPAAAQVFSPPDVSLLSARTDRIERDLCATQRSA